MNIIETNLSFGSLTTRKSTARIILHHAAASVCDAKTIHQWHKNNGWAGIGYHFVVRKNGTIERGRPENTVGAHASGANSNSIGICFEGNFETEAMPDLQKNAGKELAAYLKNKYGITTVQRHKDVGSTSCPGKNFPFAEIAGASGNVSVTTSNASVSASKKEILEVDGKMGTDTTRRAQQVFGTTVDGKISNQLSCYKSICDGILSAEWNDTKKGGSLLVKALQKWLGVKADGYLGPDTIKAWQTKMGTIVDGKISNPSQCIKAFQIWLNNQ